MCQRELVRRAAVKRTWCSEGQRGRGESVTSPLSPLLTLARKDSTQGLFAAATTTCSPQDFRAKVAIVRAAGTTSPTETRLGQLRTWHPLGALAH